MKVNPPKAARLPPIPESQVQATAMAILSAHGCIVHRRNTGAMTMAAEGNWKRRFVRFSEPGASDLWGLLPEIRVASPTIRGDSPSGGFPAGIHYELEIKRAGERPTLDQIRWILRHNGVGMSVAWWSDSSESVEKVLRHVLGGGRIEYLDTTRVYTVKEKGVTMKIEGPSGEYRLA